MTTLARTYETRTFLDASRPLTLVDDILSTRFEDASVICTCRLQRVRPQMYDSYGTRYENVYLPPEEAGTGTIRLDFVTPEIVRVRFACGDSVPDNAITDAPGNTPMVVGRFSEPVELQHRDEGDRLVLATRSVELVIDKQPWQLRLYRRGRREPGEEVFATRSRSMPTRLPDMGFTFDPSWNFYHRFAYPLGVAEPAGEHPEVFDSFDLAADEHIYGLGESYLKLDKHGQRVELWNEEVYNNASAGGYKRIPFYASTRGYGLFINTSHPITMDMGDLTGIAGSITVHGAKSLDYYLIYGPSLKETLSRYTDITGKPGLPPKWTFGGWMSRLTYGSQEQVEQVADDLRAHAIPTDVIHIDTGWFTQEGYCDLEFDPVKFPDPAGMLARLRAKGFRVSLWQWPNMMVGNRMYEEAKARGFLVRRTDGQVYHQGGFQDDGAPLDYSNPEMVAWIQDKFRKLFDLGVSAIKVDFGEGAPADGQYRAYDGAAMHNLYALLYNRALFEVTEAYYGAGNAAIWARSAWAGSQRYPLHWSGDGVALWRDLACTLRSGLSFGLSGFPFWSHDIGGFVGNPTPELYARWVQLGMFSSHARAHGAPPREPWCYGERTEAIYRAYAGLRYRLMPYIYSQAVESAAASLPLLRALVVEYQDDPTVSAIEDEYLFGENILVAPILDERGRRMVYLPKGQWVAYWTKDVIEGGRWIEVAVDLETLPLWVRGGAIIPMGPLMQYVNEKPLDPLTVELYAPAGSSSMTVHDQGNAGIRIAYDTDGRQGRVRVGPTPGRVELVWYGIRVANVSVDGVSIPVSADGCGQHVTFDGKKGAEVLWTTAVDV